MTENGKKIKLESSIKNNDELNISPFEKSISGYSVFLVDLYQVNINVSHFVISSTTTKNCLKFFYLIWNASEKLLWWPLEFSCTRKSGSSKTDIPEIFHAVFCQSENTFWDFNNLGLIYWLIIDISFPNIPQSAFTCSKLTIEILEEGVKYVHTLF